MKTIRDAFLFSCLNGRTRGRMRSPVSKIKSCTPCRLRLYSLQIENKRETMNIIRRQAVSNALEFQSLFFFSSSSLARGHQSFMKDKCHTIGVERERERESGCLPFFARVRKSKLHRSIGRIVATDESLFLPFCSLTYEFGQQHESSIFIIRSFHSPSDQPFYIIRTISRASRQKEQRERKRERERERKRIITVQSPRRQRQRIRIHTHPTSTHTSTSLLSLVRSRSREQDERGFNAPCLPIVSCPILCHRISITTNIER